ncbi:Reverse transcriptase (RNA-dependent DNA polymerase) [Photorhabdus australis subsp. thailandensis]|uniref:Reverse transcriptase (RNA-dependent DNA polymerase) n=1 Tax=Photorhabdus australis subsp. thailandensis TaxID=2805096 RepID=A0A1C0U0H2_9GAMM|nr:Reverse transcriptase (RNA-dependent DNA polymerase) [Photorhabdus australis subsp. thailandensis]
MIRYADDAVLGFQKHQDARACQSLLQRRLMQFGLKVHPAKTRLVRFGRFALKQYEERPKRDFQVVLMITIQIKLITFFDMSPNIT